MVKLFYKLLLIFVFMLSATLLYQKNIYAYHTLTQIDPTAHTQSLIDQGHYADAAEYLDYFMAFAYVKNNPKAQALQKEISTKRASLNYQSQKALEGVRTGTSDELVGQASAIGSDFFVVGDIRDLYLQAKHYFKHEEVDSMLVALSSIGLVATAGTLFSAGSGAVAKGGVSILKLAQKSKRIPTWLQKFILRESKQLRKTKNISHFTPLFKALSRLRKETGLSQTLKLLSSTSSLKELQAISKLGKRYGKQTSTLLKLTDKQILKQSQALRHIDTHTIQLASTYGSHGITHLLKGGEKRFLKTIKRMKAYAKVGVKGEVWKIFLSLMKHLSDTMLMVIMGISSLFLLPWRRFPRFTD